MSEESKAPDAVSEPDHRTEAAEPAPKIVLPGKKEILHVEKFMGGRMTPHELWQKIGARKPCMVCGGAPVVRALTYAPLKDVQKTSPQFIAALIATNPARDGTLPTTEIHGEPYLKMGDETACELHKKDLEIACAHAPSYYFVDFDRGPEKRQPFSAVPLALVPGKT